ncbi:MAG: CarD family transcriptional regulator [Treponema sp.]|jgi:CarD family transcriptional regulator|nr:CarD family transcriptional regulator [Treponema sp.]
MSVENTAFVVEQKVVYPSQGVGKIVEIQEKKFKDTNLLYYVIYLAVTDMTIMVPVDKAGELGIRAIVPAEEAQQALDMIGGDFEPITSDWKLRYQMNLDLLKKGTVADIATIVRSLYHRSKVKDLPIQERRLYDSAKKLFEDEISFSLGIPAKEVEAMIHARLEPADGRAAKNKDAETDAFNDDEDEDFSDGTEEVLPDDEEEAVSGDDKDSEEDDDDADDGDEV